MMDWLAANWLVVALTVFVAGLVVWRLNAMPSPRPTMADSVSSLHGVISRLDEAAKEGKAAAEKLRINAELAERLADIHRLTLDQIITLLRQIQMSAAASGATGLRIEAQADKVAADLEASHKRADDTETSDHGAAADAASKSPPL